MSGTLQQWVLDRCAPDPNTGCWHWTQALLRCGYGRTQYQRQAYLAHRFSYMAFKGPIPLGLTLDHLCRCRSCVNPDHLEPVSMRENLMRSPIAPSAKNFTQTHCKRGHAFTPENTYTYKRSRHCRTCSAARRIAWVSANLDWSREYGAKWHRERRAMSARSGAHRTENPPSALVKQEGA